jgi:hypothetical protein
MYKVDFKKRESLILDDTEGLKIKLAFENKDIPWSQVISIKSKEMSFRKMEISFVDKFKETRSQVDKTVIDNNKLAKDLYLQWINKTPTQKAEREDFLHLFRKGFEDWNEDTEAKMTFNLRKFFEENPKRTYGDPTYYLPYIKDKKVTLVMHSAIRTMTSVISQDMHFAMYGN